eukprot:RCo048537
MEGVLMSYSSVDPYRVLFRAGNSPKVVVFIDGLSGGLKVDGYIPELSRALRDLGWSLVLARLSSSYTGYGISSLTEDSMEMDELLTFLQRELSCTAVVGMGHSTGCQDWVWYFRRKAGESAGAEGAAAEPPGLVKGVVLQAPVSDREYLATLPSTEGWVALARDLVVNGKEETMILRRCGYREPVSAGRLLSLATREGEDDLFSSDFSTEELSSRGCGALTVPTLVVYSMADQFVPAAVDKAATVARLVEAIPG